MFTSLHDLARHWDCIVIGAGPAGALAARQIAMSNANVLLVDKNAFPRSKVCGCCINGSAQNALDKVGLDNLLKERNAVPLHQVLLFDGNRSAPIALPSGMCLSRDVFDSALIDEAITSGASFAQETSANVVSIEGKPAVKLQSSETTVTVNAKIVIVADGLSGNALEHLEEFKPSLEANSRFGAGVIVSDASEFIKRGTIYMACAPHGYVGLVRLEDDRVDIAAALDHDYSRDLHGPANASAEILSQCGIPVPPSVKTSRWTGTQLLTRRRSIVAANRLFIAGDACGYPEPFTGEGIAWALWSALYVSPLALEGMRDWHSELIDRWTMIHKRLLKQQSRSAFIAHILRHDLIRKMSVAALARFPNMVSPVVQHISQSIDG